jgi:hypothetical protein
MYRGSSLAYSGGDKSEVKKPCSSWFEASKEASFLLPRGFLYVINKISASSADFVDYISCFAVRRRC